MSQAAEKINKSFHTERGKKKNQTLLTFYFLPFCENIFDGIRLIFRPLTRKKNCRHFILSVMNLTTAHIRIRQKQMKRFKTFPLFSFLLFALPHRHQDTSTKRLGTVPILFICPPLAVSPLTHYGGRLLIKLKLGCGDNYSYSQISCCSEYISMQFGCGDDSLQIFFSWQRWSYQYGSPMVIKVPWAFSLLLRTILTMNVTRCGTGCDSLWTNSHLADYDRTCCHKRCLLFLILNCCYWLETYQIWAFFDFRSSGIKLDFTGIPRWHCRKLLERILKNRTDASTQLQEGPKWALCFWEWWSGKNAFCVAGVLLKCM